MGIIELILLAAGLAMDAFAVSICKGLALQKINTKYVLACGLWFGGFQALMPIIGYAAGMSFSSYIVKFDHWIAFVLLAAIGISMIKEALSKKDEDQNDSFDIKTMFLLAVATSIDALAVGVTFVCVPVNILGGVGELYNTLAGAAIIGVITCAISCAGVKIGNVFGLKYKGKAEIAGGIILILLGVKILIQHLVEAI